MKMKKALTISTLFMMILFAFACEKHAIVYNSQAVDENMSSVQIFNYIPETTAANATFEKVVLNGQLVALKIGQLNHMNAIPSGSVGRFFATTAGASTLELYKNEDDQTPVYSVNIELPKGKCNLFIYDITKDPIIFDNEFPYPTNITTNTDSIAHIKFYNFLFEDSQSSPYQGRIQYQWQHPVTNEWANLGEPVAFGEATSWSPVIVIKDGGYYSSGFNTSGSCRIRYNIRKVNSDGTLGDKLVVNNKDYYDYWIANIGRAYHHTLRGYRTTSLGRVSQFTAL